MRPNTSGRTARRPRPARGLATGHEGHLSPASMGANGRYQQRYGFLRPVIRFIPMPDIPVEPYLKLQEKKLFGLFWLLPASFPLPGPPR